MKKNSSVIQSKLLEEWVILFMCEKCWGKGLCSTLSIDLKDFEKPKIMIEKETLLMWE
jgi:hypothetical protein